VKRVILVISDYYFNLYKKLIEAGIEIPFPQRDIHIRSLSEQIQKNFKKFLNPK